MSKAKDRRNKAAGNQPPASSSQPLIKGTPVENTQQEGQTAEQETPVQEIAAEAATPATAEAAVAEESAVAVGEEGVTSAPDAVVSAEEGSMPAVNINTEMPQDPDPIESGEMKVVMEAMIDPVPEITPVDAAAAVDTPAVSSANVGEEEDPMSEEEAYLAGLLVNGTEAQKRILAAVETFSQRLTPKAPISAEDCNRAQIEFLRHMCWLLKKDYDIFRGGWNALLVYFSVNHGIPTPTDYSSLSEYSATRYLSSWPKTQEECILYVNLLSLLRATRNRPTRKYNLKLIDLNKIGIGIFTEKELSNLKQFYEA